MQSLPHADRFEHLTFLGDRPAPPRETRHPLPRFGRPSSTDGARLPADSTWFFEDLLGRWGLSLDSYRPTVFARRQPACLRAIRCHSPSAARRSIAEDEDAAERALEAFLIGVTGFFRDPEVFEAVRLRLPSLARNDRPLRVLSVGCSDGSEVYSLAILLAEEGLLEGAQLHGIDRRPGAVAAARAARYGTVHTKGVGTTLRRKYFEPVEDTGDNRPGTRARTPSVRVIEPIRTRCRWEVADALRMSVDFAPTEGFDLVLCRNLAIYLRPLAADTLWDLCRSSLRSGGLLVVGKAERPSGELRRLERCLYEKS